MVTSQEAYTGGQAGDSNAVQFCLGGFLSFLETCWKIDVVEDQPELRTVQDKTEIPVLKPLSLATIMY